ncbi:MAG: FG-GAP-like repeat-containing protein, partial [candidate division Zixibacteria bacterium]
MAPGEGILSLRADDLDLYGSESNEPGVHIIEDYYYLMSGTSMACPTVAGVAAYVRALSPGLSPDRTKEVLTSTARDITDPYGIYGWDLPGWDKYSGWGQVDLEEAINGTPAVTAEILSPIPNEILVGSIYDIKGTAAGDVFEAYTIEYGEGWNPEIWTEINSSASTVTDGILGSWATESLTGHYTLRLRVGEDSYDMVTVFIGFAPTAEIISPLEGDALSGFTNIFGSAFGAEFSHWVLDYRLAESGVWTELSSKSLPADGELLDVWRTCGPLPGLVPGLAAGDYVLRLSTFTTAGLVAQDEVLVTQPPPIEPDWLVDLGDYAATGANYGDFDGDGQQEIVIGTRAGIKIFNADGSEKTTGISDFPAGNFRTLISVGNLDGDGIDDMVCLRDDEPGVYGFLSSGNDFVIPVSSTYLDFSSASIEMRETYVVLHDHDNDGIDEMYLKSFCSYSRRYLIPLKVGDVEVTQVWPGISDFVPVDLDNNGTSGLFCYQFDSNRVVQYSSTGIILNSYSMAAGMDGFKFDCYGMSAHDVDDDDNRELIISGCFVYIGSDDENYPMSDVLVYVFDEGLNLKYGWPHNTKVVGSFFPTHPVFGDIDNDGTLEYFMSLVDITAGLIKGWHIDGTPYEFATGDYLTVDSAWPSSPLLVDIDGDDQLEIIMTSFGGILSSRTNSISAWNSEGALLPGFPI